jgi:hypothetical protein
MARRSVPPPIPKTPILTVGQKRRRIERLRKCIQRLEAFDPLKVQKRVGVPEVRMLEADIDKALYSAFGYGTARYLRYNLAATLDPSPLITNEALRGVQPPGGGPRRHDAKVQEARQRFSEGKERSIALLREAIFTLEGEIAGARPVVESVQESKATRKEDEVQSLQPSQGEIAEAQSVGESVRESKTTRKEDEVRSLRLRLGGGIDLKAAWRRVGRWWRGRN